MEIGGYFNLELSSRGSFLHCDGNCLNTGRNALEYILSSLPRISRLWIPYFTCDAIIEPITRLKVPHSFYSINEGLEIAGELTLLPDEYVLVTNYFGLKDAYVRRLASRFKDKLIVDNAQAYFCEPVSGIKTIYSPRKFVGVPDGGIAFMDNGRDVSQYDADISYDRCVHLLKRFDLAASEGYADFKNNSLKLSNRPIRQMSSLTKALLQSIDFESIRRRRIDNFMTLHQSLSTGNGLEIPPLDDFSCPMVYPYFTKDASLKKKMIENKVYVATYWPNVFNWCCEDVLEYVLADRMVALPIDQRYGKEEMNRISIIIKEWEKK